MTSTMIFAMMLVCLIVVPFIRVESKPMEPELGRFGSAPEISNIATRSVTSLKIQSEVEMKDGPSKKDEDWESDAIVSAEEENQDDLETAAGTNVLRPLFVYRQQLAYRARVKKSGRRAAPNFF